MEQVVLVRRINAPVIHRPECRHLKGKPIGAPHYSLIEVTDELRKQVGYGYDRVCRTCKPDVYPKD